MLSGGCEHRSGSGRQVGNVEIDNGAVRSGMIRGEAEKVFQFEAISLQYAAGWHASR